MSTLETLLPSPRIRELDQVDVAVAPERAYEVLRHFDLARSPIVRGLFALRTLPSRLRGQPASASMRVDDIGAPGTGFHVLVDEPGRAFAVGAVGRFWEPDIPFADVGPETFAAFAEPGYGKVAWEIRVEPLDERRTRIVLELRVATTSDDAWPPLRRYFRLIGPFSRFIRRNALHAAARELGRTKHHHVKGSDVGQGALGAAAMLFDFATPFRRGARASWGLTEAEALRAYPGDDRVPDPRWSWTHAVTIDAPAARAWPWIVQIGQDKGGFYSFQLLENLAGCDLENADEVHPEWQELRAGDKLRLHPKAELDVTAVEPGRWFLAEAPAGGEVQVTWLFFLEPLGEARCRFVSRYRVAFEGASARTRFFFGRALVEPIGFEMDRRMLLGVKERAERTRAEV